MRAIGHRVVPCRGMWISASSSTTAQHPGSTPPTTSTSHTSSGTSAPTSVETAPPTTAPPTSAPPTSAPPTTAPPPAGLSAGPYGFLVPVGWELSLPLTNYGGPAAFAKFDDPASGGQVDFMVSGGEYGAAYLPDGQPNPAGLLAGSSDPAYSGPVSNLAPCTVTSETVLATTTLIYGCAANPGLVTEGVIVVSPNPRSTGTVYKIVQATLPAATSNLVRDILDSVKIQ